MVANRSTGDPCRDIVAGLVGSSLPFPTQGPQRPQADRFRPSGAVHSESKPTQDACAGLCFQDVPRSPRRINP